MFERFEREGGAWILLVFRESLFNNGADGVGCRQFLLMILDLINQFVGKQPLFFQAQLFQSWDSLGDHDVTMPRWTL